jgi:hydrogenase maturation factor
VAAHADFAPRCGPDDHCITCGDEAVAMRVLRIDADEALALCEDGAGSRATIEIGLLDPVSPGDAVLTHAGVALVRLERGAA